MSYVYRPTDRTTLLPYDPAAPPPASSIRQTTTMDGLTVPMIVALGARRDQPVHVLDPGPVAVLADGSTLDLSAWNRKALFSFSGGVAIGALPGQRRAAATCATSPACRWATRSSTRPGTRTNTHYNLQLGGETAIMVKDHFVSDVRRAGVHGRGRRLRRRDPAVRLRAEPSRADRRRRAAVLVPGHGHADDPRRRLRAARALARREGRLADPLSMWRTWVNRTLIEGMNASASVISEPVRAVLGWMPYMPTRARPSASTAGAASHRSRSTRSGTRTIRPMGRPRLQPGRPRLRSSGRTGPTW